MANVLVKRKRPAGRPNEKINLDFAVHLMLPTGKVLVFSWNSENNYQTELPTEITYIDDFKKKKVYEAAGNYAEHVLNAHPDLLELVSTKEADPVKLEKKKEVVTQ